MPYFSLVLFMGFDGSQKLAVFTLQYVVTGAQTSSPWYIPTTLLFSCNILASLLAALVGPLYSTHVSLWTPSHFVTGLSLDTFLTPSFSLCETAQTLAGHTHTFTLSILFSFSGWLTLLHLSSFSMWLDLFFSLYCPHTFLSSLLSRARPSL